MAQKRPRKTDPAKKPRGKPRKTAEKAPTTTPLGRQAGADPVAPPAPSARETATPASRERYVAAKARTGSRIDRRRLVVGELPPKMIAVKREGRKYRRELEQAVIDAHGEISVTQSHLIDTATAATIHAGICRWILRNKVESMSAAEIMTASKNIASAKADRDRAVKQLDLDKPPQAPWLFDAHNTEETYADD